MMLSPEPFGALPDGRAVHSYTLRSPGGGLELRALDYGGIVTHLWAPDRHGRMEDLVLGFSSLDPYLAGHPYFGAITGRVAGRTTGGRFTLEGRDYQLACNDGANHLHGGLQGLDKRLWQAEPQVELDGGESLRLRYHSPAGEEGYPGAVDFTVTYTVTARNEFIIETLAESGEPTPVNLTHHGYFNLAGEGAGPAAMLAHELYIYSEAYFPRDASMALRGERASVAGQACDLRQPCALEAVVALLQDCHGDLYELPPHEPAALTLAAVAFHHGSGRLLQVHTTEPCVQFYTGTSLDGTLPGKAGQPYERYAGFCLEAESYPDALNAPHLGIDILARPGRPRRQTTIYAFSTR